LGQKLVHVQGEFPGRPAEEESEEFLAKLKLLVVGKLVQSLVDLKLLAEVEMDSSLVKLEFLLEKEMVEPLVNLDSKHAFPQVGSPMFLLPVINEGLMPV
jgi:hypothetical protein